MTTHNHLSSSQGGLEVSRVVYATTLVYLAIEILIVAKVVGNVQTNRRWIAWVRMKLGLNKIFNLGEASDAAWSEGPGIYWTRLVLLAPMMYLPVVQIAEGQRISPMFFLFQGLGTLYFVNPNRSVEYIHFLNLVVYLQQVITLVLMRNFNSSILPVLDRVLLFRCCQSFLTIEQLDISLIHFVLLCATCMYRRAEAPNYDLWSPSMLLFFIFNLPGSILSIRGKVAERYVYF